MASNRSGFEYCYFADGLRGPTCLGPNPFQQALKARITVHLERCRPAISGSRPSAHNPTPAPAHDSILVHDVSGHSQKTWESIWPEACGAQPGDAVRVLTFGYGDSHKSHFQQRRLSTHAETLLGNLRNCRTDPSARMRPLVFLGYSTGGIIIKKIFLATPHCATGDWNTIASKLYEAEPLNKVLKRKAPDALVSLEDSKGLEQLALDFESIQGRLALWNYPLGKPVAKGKPILDESVMEGRLGTHLCRSNIDEASRGWLLTHIQEIERDLPAANRVKYLRTVLHCLDADNIRWNQDLGTPTPGSCGWIQHEQLFDDWLYWRGSGKLLSIKGDMGCGKTYLAKHITKLVLEQPPPRDSDQSETIAFCSLEGIKGGYKDAESVLVCLLDDVLVNCPELVVGLIEKVPNEVLHNHFRRLRHCEILEAWYSMLGIAGENERRLTFIVDGMDQLDFYEVAESYPDRMNAGSFLKALTGQIGDPRLGIRPDLIRVLALGRPDNEKVNAGLAGCGFLNYHVPVEKTKSDIEVTVKEVMSHIVKHHGYDPKLDDKIQRHINKTADGMYLWACLALGELAREKLHTGWEARFPNNSIFKLYDDILRRLSGSAGRIQTQLEPMGRKEFLRNVLFWMTYQAQPMDEGELRVACAMIATVGGPQIDSNVCPENAISDAVVDNPLPAFRNVRRAILAYCAPLVRIRSDHRFEPIHRSLQVYLTTPTEELKSRLGVEHHGEYACDGEHADRIIESLCMDYLLLSRFGSPQCHEKWEDKIEARINDNAFVEYAALHWTYHARLSGDPLNANFSAYQSSSRKYKLLNMENEHAVSWAEVWWYNKKWPSYGPFPSKRKEFSLHSVLSSNATPTQSVRSRFMPPQSQAKPRDVDQAPAESIPVPVTTRQNNEPSTPSDQTSTTSTPNSSTAKLQSPQHTAPSPSPMQIGDTPPQAPTTPRPDSTTSAQPRRAQHPPPPQPTQIEDTPLLASPTPARTTPTAAPRERPKRPYGIKSNVEFPLNAVSSLTGVLQIGPKQAIAVSVDSIYQEGGPNAAYLTNQTISIFGVGLETQSTTPTARIPLSSSSKWSGLGLAGQFVAAWGTSGKEKSPSLMVIKTRLNKKPPWVPIQIPHHTIKTFNPNKRVAVSRQGYIAWIHDCQTVISVVNLNLYPVDFSTKKTPVNAQPFVDVAFNDTGMLLYAWAKGCTRQRLAGLFVYRMDRLEDGHIESKSYYPFQSINDRVDTRLIPYNSYNGCIIVANDQYYYPAIVVSGSASGHAQKTKNCKAIKSSRLKASCMYNNHSLVAVQSLGSFRHSYRLTEYPVISNHFAEPIDLGEVKTKVESSSEIKVVQAGIDVYVFIFHLNGKYELVRFEGDTGRAPSSKESWGSFE
ncbi:hypothetical protein B0H67DRAFT_612080 [Lasiosphaeris hirsuta]|uniref:Nephrocystin 3-like N-terminal domain-containing protein n=1 Tax=Lasiosphaeris hirsuta TaxID=260670 RepID=A0AA40A133_9PEZI|nr:hypothetical protein B0H67DRAFT_612080 [Lasiosphaeris hirsuta]